MSLKERILESIGIFKIDAEVDALASEFLHAGAPGTRTVEFYPDYARFREFMCLGADGKFIEFSGIIRKSSANSLSFQFEGCYKSRNF